VTATRPRRFGTMRVRVTAVATIAVAVVLLVASAMLVISQRAGLIDQLDDTLSAEAEAIAESLTAGDALQVRDDDDRVVVVIGPDGVMATSPDDVDVEEFGTGAIDGDRGDDARDVTVAGDAYRMVSTSFDPAEASAGGDAGDPDPGDDDGDDAGDGDDDGDAAVEDGDGVVLVAASREDVDESVAELTASLLWIVPLAVLALLGIVWLVVGRTLRPVEQIRAEVADIGVAELDKRVPEPAGGDEIARLAVTMNEMLDRLERSVRRQQRFVADASHELRTPLTRMRTELEVDEADPSSADVAATRRSQLHEIARLQAMIEALLVLARADADTPTTPAGTVDLDDIVLEEIRTLQQSPVVVDATGVSAAQVVGDAGELRRLVRNLIDNAARHARSTVTIELTEIGTMAVLTVTDDGPGIPPDRRAEVFERFSRLDESRTAASGGAGLGLAIVNDIITRAHGTISLDAGPSGGARFVVVIPTKRTAHSRQTSRISDGQR